MEEDHNPCVGICQIDESGYCIGCGRSAEQIFGDTDSDPASRDSVTEVLAPLPGGSASSSD